MVGESKVPMGPTVLWQARIPRDLARSIEDDMRVLGLDGQSEAIREALRLLHRHAREIAVAQAYDDFYGGRPAPLSQYVAALYGEDGAAGE
jgi:hypothetical protein